MPIDPTAVGAKTEPQLFEWTDRTRFCMRSASGPAPRIWRSPPRTAMTSTSGCCRPMPSSRARAFAAALKIGTFNFGMLLHGSQEIRVFAPLPPAGKLSVVSEVADIQDKGEGKNVVMLKGTGTDPKTGDVIAETLTTAVIRGAGGFGGQPGQRPPAPEIPDREPDSRIPLPTREDQALIYRLSGDRNPLHSDPWFAQKMAGFPKPILHGLCTYGSRAVRWSPGLAAVTPRRSRPSRRGSPRRCSPARRSPPRSGARNAVRRCFVPRRPIRTGPTPGWSSRMASRSTRRKPLFARRSICSKRH